MDGQVQVPTPLGHNPRCAKRDLTTYSSTNWLTFDNLYNITLGASSKDIKSFQNELQGRFEDGFMGLHAAGHYAIGGDGGDFFSSPNDPVFFMHHAMLDQVWWIWQALHPDQANTVAGTLTFYNDPPSRNATLEDLMEFNYLGLETKKIGDVMSTLGKEPLCYIYL
jgi:tyrosinase